MEHREYSLLLKRGDHIVLEQQHYTVHSIDFFEKDKFGPFANRVGIETTVGTYLTVPLAATVEVTA
jgi:hypothetical protein